MGMKKTLRLKYPHLESEGAKAVEKAVKSQQLIIMDVQNFKDEAGGLAMWAFLRYAQDSGVKVFLAPKVRVAPQPEQRKV